MTESNQQPGAMGNTRSDAPAESHVQPEPNQDMSRKTDQLAATGSRASVSEGLSHLEYALSYAGEGWPVLPLYSISDGRCTCRNPDCGSPGKHPRIRDGGVHAATTDEAKIRNWWDRWPRANVGIACGEEAGILVLDVDPRNGGERSLTELKKNYGELPLTLAVDTGGGGKHYYFEYPDDRIQTQKIGDGLDLQSDGSYVVAPPSSHHSGGIYEWTPSPNSSDLRTLQPAPDWISERAATEGSSSPSGRLPPPEPGELIYEGKRDVRLTSLAGHLRNLSLSESAIAEALLQVNREQCRPPMSEKQVRKIARSIGKREVNAERAFKSEGDDPFGFKLASEIEVEEVEWLWPHRIPLRKLTLLVGRGGLNKSTLSLDLAARLTRGQEMPETSHRCGPGKALILSTEDSASDTIRPRLEAAGADLCRVKIQTRGGGSFPKHLRQLEKEVTGFDADLVIIDPLTAFLGTKINMNDPQDVRKVLSPLKEIAERTDCVFLAVVHLNKREGASPRHRVLGSGDLVNAARSVMLVEEDPEDDDKRVVAQVKSNLGPPAKALAFSVVRSAENPRVPRINWDGESPYDPHILLNPGFSSAPSKKERAKVFIKNILRHGPVRSAEVFELADEQGFSERTLKRAKKELPNVVSKRPPSSFEDREWYWLLDEHMEAFEDGELSRMDVRDSMASLATETEGHPSNGGPSAKEVMPDPHGDEARNPEGASKSARDDRLGICNANIGDYGSFYPPRGSSFQGLSPGPKSSNPSPDGDFPDLPRDKIRERARR